MIISNHHEVCYLLYPWLQRCFEVLEAILFLLCLKSFYYFICHKVFTVTYNCIDALFGYFKAYQRMYMVRHYYITIYFYDPLILNGRTIYTIS